MSGREGLEYREGMRLGVPGRVGFPGRIVITSREGGWSTWLRVVRVPGKDKLECLEKISTGYERKGERESGRDVVG